jgi:hypothetical protein
LPPRKSDTHFHARAWQAQFFESKTLSSIQDVKAALALAELLLLPSR